MRYITAGESHGPLLTAIVYDVPAGLPVSQDQINADLARRQAGYGRSSRQQAVRDAVTITSGLACGVTTGAPIALSIGNFPVQNDEIDEADAKAASSCAAASDQAAAVAPRPGHADLVGALKTNTEDCRTVSERASARETAARVAAAGIAKEFLAKLGVEVSSYVVAIGDAALPEDDAMNQAPLYKPLDVEMSEVRCPDPKTSELMMAQIDAAKEAGDSLGGTFRVVATGLVPGLGGYATADDRLTAQLGAAILSIPAIKGVEFGLGFSAARLRGSAMHDPILLDSHAGYTRASNNAGGLEGGMTTGMPLVITAAMKPIPTLANPLESIDMQTLEPCKAHACRADVCAVPAAAVVAEAEVAFVLARAYQHAFGGSNMADLLANIKAYKARLRTVSR